MGPKFRGFEGRFQGGVVTLLLARSLQGHS